MTAPVYVNRSGKQPRWHDLNLCFGNDEQIQCVATVLFHWAVDLGRASGRGGKDFAEPIADWVGGCACRQPGSAALHLLK